MRRAENNEQPHASDTSSTPRPKAPPLSPTLMQASATSSPAVQRLSAARLDAARLPASGRIPDGTPTLAQGGRLGAAFSRFSGSGVVPRTLVQRQESRAKVMTLTLASVATILILLSAFLIFDPNLRNLGWGFAFGNRTIPNYTSQKMVVHGKAPPTPTPPPTATPLPTGVATTPTALVPTPTGAVGGGGGGAPTATVPPKPSATPIPPTATPIPTATPTATPVPPTATPDPHAGSATVTFTEASQPENPTNPINVNGTTLSGSAAPIQYGIPGDLVNYASTSVSFNVSITFPNIGVNADGWYYVSVLNANESPTKFCISPNYSLPPPNGTTTKTFQCTVTGPSNNRNGISVPGSGSSSSSICAGENAAKITMSLSCSNTAAQGSAYFVYSSVNNCRSHLATQENTADQDVTNQINQQASSGGLTLATGVGFFSKNYYCIPNIGQPEPNGTYYAQVTLNGSAVGYLQSAAQNACKNQAPGLPSGFNAWKQPQSGYSLSAPTNVSGTTVFFNCSYNWTAVYFLDNNALGTLATAMMNAQVGSAQTTCNTVTHATCKIVVTGGDGNTMPSAAGNIHFTENSP